MKKILISIILVILLLSLTIAPATTGTKSLKQNISTKKSSEEQINQTISEKIFDTFFRILMKISHKPSVAVGIIHNNSLIWSKGYGYYDIENQKTATKDTLYLQASVSKTVTATALMQLYEQGKFKLTDDISKYLPFDLKNPNHPDINITIEMVLSHRSSLADDNLYWLCLSYQPGDPDIPDWPYPWLEEYLTPNGSAYSASTWSTYKPGEKYLYANVGFSLIGYLVEIFSGQDFNDYCHEHIFEPLKMHNSSFRLRDHNQNNIAVPYEFKNGEYFRHPQYGTPLIYPAITLRTSVEEFSHFLIAHMNGGVWNGVRILQNSTVEEMHKAHFSPEDKHNYGYGWSISKKLFNKTQISHSGGYVGCLDLVTYKPWKDTTVIFFSNELDSELISSKIEYKTINLMNKLLFLKAHRLIKENN